jgi:hypothetical protein
MEQSLHQLAEAAWLRMGLACKGLVTVASAPCSAWQARRAALCVFVFVFVFVVFVVTFFFASRDQPTRAMKK